MQQEAPSGPAACHRPASFSPLDTTLAAFEANAEAWEQYTNTPLGRLREELTLHYLAQHLGTLSTCASVLDAGGGTGGYSLALAELGHEVCLLDFSAQMLAAARLKAEQRGPDVAQRIRFHRASVEDVPHHLAVDRFDLVLCHTLIEYVDDPGQVLRGLSAVLRPGGLLSLLFANAYAGPLRWALARGDLEQARRSLDTEVSSADLFGLPRRTFTADDVREAMSRAGIEPVAQYGVRVLADYMPAHRLSEPAFWSQLFELEASAGSRAPYRDIARYGYLLGRKQARS
jgi:S-adenosylmethionine-dependent methyltransferase